MEWSWGQQLNITKQKLLALLFISPIEQPGQKLKKKTIKKKKTCVVLVISGKISNGTFQGTNVKKKHKHINTSDLQKIGDSSS